MTSRRWRGWSTRSARGAISSSSWAGKHTGSIAIIHGPARPRTSRSSRRMRTWRSPSMRHRPATSGPRCWLQSSKVLSGDHRPPIAEYRLGEEHAGFFAEFLAPLKGGGETRTGTADATVERAGVTAQKLRDLDLLLIAPMAVRLDANGGVPLKRPADVLLANPVSFIAQKLLIRKSRKPEKQAQDALYVHDTIELFASTLDELNALWHQGVRPTLRRKMIKEVDRLREEQFGRVDDVIRQAARIPVGRTLTPERMQATCAPGLEEIFGVSRQT